MRYQLQSRQISHSSNFSPSIFPTLPDIPWTPSAKFLRLLTKFDSNILNQFPCASCAFCGRLMYPEKCEWINYDDSFSYSLLQAYLNIQPRLILTFHTKPLERISVCSSYKKPFNRYPFPFLHPIPNEIQSVPMKK